MRNILETLEYTKIIEKVSEYAVSDVGKARILALAPLFGVETVRAELDLTESAYLMILRLGQSPIPAFSDIRTALNRSRINAMLSIRDLLGVAQLISACERAKKKIIGEGVIADMTRSMESYRALGTEIEAAVMNEDELSDNASLELNRIRKAIRAGSARIKEKLNGYIHSAVTQKYLQDPIITIRNGRYVLPVKLEYRSNVHGLVHDQSSSGATVYIEPSAVIEINNEIKALEASERAEVERILMKFTGQVAETADGLSSNLETMTTLDFVFAKARYALDTNANKPIISDSGAIDIRSGRHPLIDKNKVVPMSVVLDDIRCLVITGPNTGGKTVTLKTVGLLTLMAQSGLFVPANEGTALPVFDAVYADIGDEQSIEQSLSTFSSHMTNIVSIMDNAGYNSLILLDELGAGTDPTEGAALAIAVLETLRRRGCTLLATTHYSELKAYAMTSEDVGNAAMEFDVKSLRPTYRVLSGVVGRSNAFEISSRLGLAADVIELAKRYLSDDSIAFEDVIASAEQSRAEAEEQKTQIERLNAELKEAERQMKLRQEKTEIERAEILSKAKEQAKEILSGAKERAEELIDELKSVNRAHEQAEMTRTIERVRTTLKSGIEEMSEREYPTLEEAPVNLLPGSTVSIDGGGEAAVISLPDDKGMMRVQAGIVKMNVHVSRVRVIHKQAAKASGSSVTRGRESIPLELDLRGLNVEEGIMMTDSYLDSASMAGLNVVHIIHGKGTGVLRKGIHAHLKKHPYVKAFRLGVFGEGEHGVTVVELK